MRSFSAAVPLFVPGVVFSAGLAMMLANRVGRLLATGSVVAFIALVGVGTILAATLTPGADAFYSGVASGGSCDMSRIGLAPISELARLNGTSLNVLLFVPLGIAAGLLPRTRRSTAIVVAAMLLPVAIETVQQVIPVLGRACQSADVVDNLTGLAIGLVLATLARRPLGLG